LMRNRAAVESSAALATWFHARIAWRRGVLQHSRLAFCLRREQLGFSLEF